MVASILEILAKVKILRALADLVITCYPPALEFAALYPENVRPFLIPTMTDGTCQI